MPTFADYSKRWLEENAGRWDSQTYERYEGILRLHIWPNKALKTRRLDEISRSLIKQTLRELLNSHSSSTVGLAHIVLNGVFNEAIDDDLVQSNPVANVLKKVLPPVNRRKVREVNPFTICERDAFLGIAKANFLFKEYLILKVISHMGLRLGEALAMRFKYFDFRNLTYYICESFKQHKFRLPKKAKKRFVDIPSYLMEEISVHMKQLKEESLKSGFGGDIDILFQDPTESGYWPYSQRRVQGLVKRVCKLAGLRLIHPHSLRHTYASILLMSGTSPKYVQEQLGHASIAITCDVYGHWIPGMGREGLEKALTGSEQTLHIAAYNAKRPQ
jgi:integrase